MRAFAIVIVFFGFLNGVSLFAMYLDPHLRDPWRELHPSLERTINDLASYPIYIRTNLSNPACKKDGYGSMQNLLRGVVWLALTRNLSYVHTPLAATHGVDSAALDAWSGHGLSQECDERCLRYVTHVRYAFSPTRLSLDKADGNVREKRNSSAARALHGFDALLTSLPPRLRGTLITVDGCPKKYYVGALERAWLVARHEDALRMTPRPLAYDPTKLNVALHLRSPDVNVSSGVQHNATEWCKRWAGRCTSDDFYVRAVKSLRHALCRAGVSSDAIQLWLFTESASPEAHRSLERALPGLKLRLGSAATVADDLEHLSAADVLLTDNSGLSLVAATLSAGIVLTSAQHKYVARSPGLPRKVVCDAGGSCPKDKLRRAVGSFLAAGGAGRRLGAASWMEGGGRNRAKCREHD